jgi:hypothetical protein
MTATNGHRFRYLINKTHQSLDAKAFDGRSHLLVADLDDNGSDDFIFSTLGTTRIWLSNPDRSLRPPMTRDDRVFSTADLDGVGRLDLIGVSSQGEASRLIGHRTKQYHWQTIRPRAAKATGDQRINAFGIGGEIEVRAGMLFQKRLIDSPLIHFGLGDQTQTDVARIIWPNGMAQAEFELKGDQTFVAEQRLKGSCPWLFAFDGKQMSFVKDCPPWSPALGLHINAQVTAGIEQVEEWFKIPGAQLAPRDGVYDLRVTCELWETYYIDRYALLVVDHPKGTEVYTDERFSIPPPPLAIFATGEPHPFVRAIDDRGTDVTAIIRELDDRYLDAGRGQYQGVSRDHYVELELGSEAPIDGQLWIIGDGFVHPTDGTVNIAMSQPAGYVPLMG